MPRKILFSTFILCFLLYSTSLFANEVKTDTLKTKTVQALEDQLSCRVSPQPGKALRAMLNNHFIKETDLGYDGIPVFIPTSDLKVFGHKVLYLSGWTLEANGDLKPPFSIGPGTAPPVFISVTLDAKLTNVNYKEQPLNAARDNAFSTIEKDSINFEDRNISHRTTITCYAGSQY